MGMNAAGGTSRAVSEINVTPLIDVLLVLLIIFMVIVPVAPRGLGALIPQPPKDSTNTPPPSTIVVQVLGTNAAPTYRINDDSFALASLEPKLAQIFAARSEKVMFVKGDADVDYAKITEVIDFGHQAGVENIGIITPRVEAGR
jgi:biopolymer transport protein ExbD/biopolymer transport protein TolR